MLLTRRDHSFLQRSVGPWTHLRGARALGAAFAGVCLTLSACEQPAPDREESRTAESESQAVVTAAFEPAGEVGEMAFVPSGDAPWTGLIAAALRSGGFDIYNIDGRRVIEAPGPRLRGLAAAPDFAIRGNQFPLLVGVDDQGVLRGFLVIRDLEQVVEAPLEAIAPAGAVQGLCAYDTGPGFLDVAVLGGDPVAEIWRVRDRGEDALSVESRTTIPLPFAARACAASGDDLVVGGPAEGLVRVTPEGDVEADVRDVSVTDLIYVELLGRRTVAAPSAPSGELLFFDADTLAPIKALTFSDGLNAPAARAPTAIAATDASYGGMGYASGVVAVFDADDSRVKLVARDVISRAVVTAD